MDIFENLPEHNTYIIQFWRHPVIDDSFVLIAKNESGLKMYYQYYKMIINSVYGFVGNNTVDSYHDPTYYKSGTYKCILKDINIINKLNVYNYISLKNVGVKLNNYEVLKFLIDTNIIYNYNYK